MTVEKNSSDVGTSSKSGGCCQTITNTITSSLERFFYKVGVGVSKWPAIVIAVCLIISALCLIGLLEYTEESRGDKLWVDQESKSLDHQAWVSKKFPSNSRVAFLIAEHKTNLLTATGLQTLVNIDVKVRNISFNSSNEWSKICFSPIAVPGKCFPSTILEIWGNNHTKINSLSDSDILLELNKPFVKSSVTGKPLDLKLLLGGIKKDSQNKIIAAKVTKMTYFIKNQEKVISGRRVDELGEDWEKKFVKDLGSREKDLQLATWTLATFREDNGSAISADIALLGIGYILVFVYLALMIGTFSKLEQKFWLAVCGVLCIGLSIGISYGLCSAFGQPITPLHNILAFLVLGIGVDDVFVVVQSWSNVEGSVEDVSEKIGLTVKHAGVSILITSLTDVCAFLIGATTILPALRSFCIYAGVAIIAVFLLTITFFVAFLTIDAKRRGQNRCGCCCCIKVSPNWEPMSCSKRENLKSFISKYYSKGLLSMPGRIISLIVVAVFVAISGYGLSLLKQDFDQDWFLPPDSGSVDYNKLNDLYFTLEGERTTVYIGEIDYWKQSSKLEELDRKLKLDPYIVSSSVSSWAHYYSEWLNKTKSLQLKNGLPPDNKTYYTWLNEYLNTDGSRYKRNLALQKSAPQTIDKIVASSIQMNHITLESAADEITAMTSLQDLLKTFQMDGFEPFAYTRKYNGWETNKVISEELIRNLALAAAVVLIITLLLITNILTSVLVLLCVAMTLVEVAGFMHFWGLTVDTVTSIILIIAIGLAVDYSAHIGHAFMVSNASGRPARVVESLSNIGPAVIHGGMSTFLAFVLLSASTSYIFRTFFKVFFLVVLFGLFNGLVFLPVVLSLIGPQPHGNKTDATACISDVVIENKSANKIEMNSNMSPENKDAGV